MLRRAENAKENSDISFPYDPHYVSYPKLFQFTPRVASAAPAA